MDCKRTVITSFASKQLESYVEYIACVLNSKQAASNVLSDFRKTVDKLQYMAESLPLLSNVKLRERGYRRINFENHRYLILYRVEDDVVYVDAVYHALQDYENIFG